MHIITPVEKDRITLCYLFSTFIALSCKKSVFKNPHQILKRTSTVARMAAGALTSFAIHVQRPLRARREKCTNTLSTE